MDYVQILKDVAFYAIVVVGFIAVVKLYKPTLKLIENKIGKEEFERLSAQVSILVRFAEQIGKQLGWDGSAKKQMVTLALQKFAASIGADISDEEIDRLIEGAVYILNAETGKHDQLPLAFTEE